MFRPPYSLYFISYILYKSLACCIYIMPTVTILTKSSNLVYVKIQGYIYDHFLGKFPSDGFIAIGVSSSEALGVN